MKSPSALLLALCAVFLASCGSTIQHRINRNPELYARLSETEKQNVLRGMVQEGMSKDAVYFAWGRPARIATGSRNGRALERWSYMDYEPVFFSDFSFGWGYACYHDPFFRLGPTVEYVPIPGKAVEFSNGRVSSYLIPRYR